VWGNQFGVSDPEWITNDRALVFGGSGSQVSIDDLGGGDYSFTPWMTPNADQGDGELSRDGKKLATTFFYGDDTLIAFFAVSGDATSGPPPADPFAACNTSAPDARFADPTWAPDSAGLAWESSKGIETVRFTKLDTTGCATTGSSKEIAPTGSQPDWGPAEPATARYKAPVEGKQPAQPAPQPGAVSPIVVTPKPNAAKTTSTAGGALAATVGGAARQAFRGTLAVVCDAPGATACTSTATVKIGKKVHRAKGTGKPGKRMTLRFGTKSAKAIRTALRRGRAVKATVVLTAQGADGASATARRSIRLTR
jgi:hypothetical protein